MSMICVGVPMHSSVSMEGLTSSQNNTHQFWLGFQFTLIFGVVRAVWRPPVFSIS